MPVQLLTLLLALALPPAEGVPFVAREGPPCQ